MNSSGRELIGNREAGLARILFFGILFFVADPIRLATYSSASFDSRCFDKMGLFGSLDLSIAYITVLATVSKVSLFCAAIGFLTPIAFWLSFSALLIVNQSALSYCYGNHALVPVHIAMFLWALLDRGSHFRMDSLWMPNFISKWKFTGDGSAFLFSSLQKYFCIVFFISGVTKLRHSGFEWITSDTLKNYFIVQNFSHEGFFAQQQFGFLNHWIVGTPYLFHFLAFAGLSVELVAPLALIKKYPRLRDIIVTHLAIFQIGVFMIMYINFSPWAALYVCWLPLTAASKQLNFFLQKIRPS